MKIEKKFITILLNKELTQQMLKIYDRLHCMPLYHYPSYLHLDGKIIHLSKKIKSMNLIPQKIKLQGLINNYELPHYLSCNLINYLNIPYQQRITKSNFYFNKFLSNSNEYKKEVIYPLLSFNYSSGDMIHFLDDKLIPFYSITCIKDNLMICKIGNCSFLYISNIYHIMDHVSSQTKKDVHRLMIYTPIKPKYYYNEDFNKNISDDIVD